MSRWGGALGRRRGGRPTADTGRVAPPVEVPGESAERVLLEDHDGLFLLRPASDETLDTAGRIRLAKNLIDHAGLEGQCIVVGVSDHLEVWNPERWAEHYAELDEQAERMAE